MVQQFFLDLPAFPKGFHLITDHVIKALPQLPQMGLLHVFIHHTSAGLAINENADPNVRHDLNLSFDKLAPENEHFFQHNDEGPDDMPAHIKSILTGSSISLPITKGRLNLGTWQGIYLAEFRHRAGTRRLTLTLTS